MSHQVIIQLYHLLANVDGRIDEREVLAGKQMIQSEGINEMDFEIKLESLKKRKASVVYSECVEGLKRLSPAKQARYVAWLCVIANADGFMDKTEWQFIYNLYYKELNLNLDEIMKTQKELMGLKKKVEIIAFA